jgi:DNA-binding HxlR family transcriptional regulator
MRNMILLKKNSFNQFLNSIEGINTKTLAIRLQQLEEYGLVERKVIPSKPAHKEFSDQSGYQKLFSHHERRDIK